MQFRSGSGSTRDLKPVRKMRPTHVCGGNRIAHLGRVWLCPLAFALMLTGCAGEMGPIRTEPSPPPVTSFDGSYRTIIRSTGSATVAEEADWCQTPSQSIVTVANGQVNVAVPHPNLRGNPSPNYRATMTQDGSFSDQSASGSLSGRVSETDIDGRIDGAGCLYAFSGHRM